MAKGGLPALVGKWRDREGKERSISRLRCLIGLDGMVVVGKGDVVIGRLGVGGWRVGD